MNSYVLGLGAEGKDRLAILNDLFGKSSQDLLWRAGLDKNKTVLEIGCGTGNMTTWIAEQAEHVYAVDMSDEQLQIAKQQADQKNIKNITFIKNSITALKDIPPVDMIYGRFIVMHIPDPFRVLQYILRFLKVGGSLICEEGTNSVTCCYPFSAAFQKYRELLLSLGKAKNLDFDLGEKLYSYFQQLGLKNISANFIQPVYQNREQKLQIVFLIQEIKSNIIQHNIATEAEIDQLIKELNGFIDSDQYFASMPRMTQIYAKI